MNSVHFTSVVLAAGRGTRMKSAVPKVLHRVAGKSMLGHVLGASRDAGAQSVVLVVSDDQSAVRKEASQFVDTLEIAVQERQLGTADALKAALPALAACEGPILVAYGDTPLLTPKTLASVVEGLSAQAAISILGFRTGDPYGYGRLLLDDAANVTAIREELDATEDERRVDLCNSGVMAFRSLDVLDLVRGVSDNNAKKEFYLTDIIAIAREEGLFAQVVECDETEVLGVNSRGQLAQVEALMQDRLRNSAMAEGVTMQAPDTVYLSHDTVFGTDVLIEPNVIFGPQVRIGSNVVVYGHSHLAGVDVGDGVAIGPFARLRPGARLEENSKVGNFVEVKNATLEQGAKVNHLTYIGDARVGAGANVGAGTITCNYDGRSKHFTDIGAGAFIGSNSALVAPVAIGDGAYVGTGSVITRDVAPDALAVARPKQIEREGWARRKRQADTADGKPAAAKPQELSAKG
jgi:bifunctional UDP-N-acetylglucosamine pyrophosphorylase/glucosamine-1-phosphate N-acetyltransferase